MRSEHILVIKGGHGNASVFQQCRQIGMCKLLVLDPEAGDSPSKSNPGRGSVKLK